MITFIRNWLPYLIVAGLIAGAVWWTVEGIYQLGRKMERLEWIEKTEAAEKLALKKRSELKAQLKAESEQREKNISRALGVYANEITKLNSDLARAADQRMYVSAKKYSCDTGLSDAGKNENPSRARESVSVELSEPDAAAIRGDYYAAADLELRYNLLAGIVKDSGCIEVVE